MQLRRHLHLAIALVGLAAAPATAQQYLYYNACGGAYRDASLKVCASADVSLIGSTLTMRVWNMEVAGSDGLSSYSSEFGGWHTIVSAGLEYVGTGTASGGDLTYVRYIFGNGPEGRIALNDWRSVNDGRNPLMVELGGITTGRYEGITGCTQPSMAWDEYVSTCQSYGQLPYVRFTFTGVDTDINLADYNFEFYSTELAGGNLAKPSGAGVALPPTEVVPEPITMVLLGSGLLGVGGVNLRRRRREENEVSEDVA